MIIRNFDKNDIYKGLLQTYKEAYSIDEITTDTVDDVLKNNNHMVVCEVDGEIIGSATLHLQKKIIRNGGLAGFIEDVAVREKYRGHNIGSKLIQHLIDKAKELGCYKITLSCIPERVEFYKRNGFIEHSKTMRYNING